MSAVPGGRAGRAAVVDLPTGEWVVLAEPDRRAGEAADEPGLRRAVRKAAVRVALAQPDAVAVVPPWD